MVPPRMFFPVISSWKSLAVISLVVFAVLLVVPRFGFWPLLLFLWLGVPLLKNFLRSIEASSARASERRAAEGEHSSSVDASGRTYHAPSAYDVDLEEEKPKRRPEYTVGDDGELIEVEPDPTEDKPKRRGYGEYV